MGKIATATFSGESGTDYSFNVYTSDTTFKDISAVYIFTKRTEKDNKGTHELLYIGESDQLGTRIANHEKWDSVNKHGCNCICVHAIDGDKARVKAETDLRNGNITLCNDQ
ncbi:MAG: GIY-YIG nuclease family protein [Alphaproteobacteria bacterium]|nr:GIY-YIG nuclease family protein [Alphaproteobacteria bacterium]MDE2630623.1 GIY-YIG nuclease family protein [Alphaproteobacteria bacterium]